MNVYMEENPKGPTDQLLELVKELSKITNLCIYICSVSMYVYKCQ